MSDIKPEGYYKATIKDIELHEVNDKECVTITYDVEGQTLFFDGYFTPAAEQYTWEALEAADTGKTMNGDLEKIDTLVGNENDVTVRHKTHEGNTRAIVRFINGARKRKTLSSGRRAALAARMKTKLGGSTSNNAGGEVPFNV